MDAVTLTLGAVGCFFLGVLATVLVYGPAQRAASRRRAHRKNPLPRNGAERWAYERRAERLARNARGR